MIFTSAAFVRAEPDRELVHASLIQRQSLRAWIIRVSLAASFVTAHYTKLDVSEGLESATEELQLDVCFLHHIMA